MNPQINTTPQQTNTVPLPIPPAPLPPTLIPPVLPVLSQPQDKFDDEVEVLNIGKPAVVSTITPQQSQKQQDDPIERRKLLMTIALYKAKHGMSLGCLQNVLATVETMTNEQLEDVLDDIQVIVGITSSTMILHGVSEMAFNSLERLDVNFKGVGTALNSNAEYKNTLDEIGIKYASTITIDPLTRLGFIVASTVFAVYNANKQNNKTISAFTANAVNVNVAEKYKDL